MKTFITAVAVAAALATAGCGGDDKKKSDSGSSDSNRALSYDEFGQKANAICTATNAKVKPLSEKFTGSAANDAPLFDTVLPAIKDGVAQFKKLKPPSELQAPFDEFISISDQQIAASATAQTSAQTGDDAVYQEALEELQGLDEQSDLAASKLGAAECAN